MKYIKYLLIIIIALYSGTCFSQTKVLDSLFQKLNKATADTERVSLYNDISAEYTGNDPAKMMQYAKKARELAQKKQLKKGEADSWFNMGNGYIMQSNYTEAFKSFTNAQVLYEQLLREPGQNKLIDVQNCLGQTYGSLGVVCSEQKQLCKST
jgi:tetratricopeptide (TPR) repeat protein